MRAHRLLVALAALAALAAVACSAPKSAAPNQVPASDATFDPASLPTGPMGLSISYGRQLVVDTRRLMKDNVTVRMNCSACHIDGGLKDRGGSFVGTYSRFPQWNRRAHRVITLQDRLAECFLYSMNGHPPGYASKEMVAMVAYIAWLSRGTRQFATPDPARGFVKPLPSRSPDVANGAKIYIAKCASCHRADGNGLGDAFPPLWGAQSFNNGAGMAHLDRMTGFVRYNMPQNAPGTLSQTDAYDVSAWVLTHRRPKFAASAAIVQPSVPAGYF
jgi:thiosulfate dehydrogenase